MVYGGRGWSTRHAARHTPLGQAVAGEEGLRIKDAAIRVGGRALWDAFERARDALVEWARRESPPAQFPRDLVVLPPYSAEQQRRREAYEQAEAPVTRARAAFLDPLLDAWNGGQLVAKGRREDPLASPIEIPPPVTGWRFRILDLDRSIISCQPTRRYVREKIFDLRFWPKDPPPTPAAASLKEPAAQKETLRWKVREAAIRHFYPDGVPGEVATSAVETQVRSIWPKVCEENGATDFSKTPPGWTSINRHLRREP